MHCRVIMLRTDTWRQELIVEGPDEETIERALQAQLDDDEDGGWDSVCEGDGDLMDSDTNICDVTELREDDRPEPLNWHVTVDGELRKA
jgi:hypothetical protein